MSAEARSAADVSVSGPAKTLDPDSESKSSNLSTDDAASTDRDSESVDATASVEEEEDGEEAEGECGFCVFMKGGGCKDAFVAWEECIEAAERGKEDIAEKCFEATSLLRKCMEAHAEYYEPVLRAEKAAEEVATIEVEKEMAEEERKAGGSGGASSSSGKQDV
uniref:GCK domain-containing protein n=1 Tax=Kalanchoe fedtschenkoi TaxID=63787 RepID=A0A7N0ZVY8_KALFE